MVVLVTLIDAYAKNHDFCFPLSHNTNTYRMIIFAMFHNFNPSESIKYVFTAVDWKWPLLYVLACHVSAVFPHTSGKCVASWDCFCCCCSSCLAMLKASDTVNVTASACIQTDYYMLQQSQSRWTLENPASYMEFAI